MKNAAYFRKRCPHKTWECKPAVQYVTINLNNNLHNFSAEEKMCFFSHLPQLCHAGHERVSGAGSEVEHRRQVPPPPRHRLQQANQLCGGVGVHGRVRGGAAQHGGLVDLAALPGIQEKNKNKNSYCLHKNHIFFVRARTTISLFAANIYFAFCRKICGNLDVFVK